MSSTDAGFPVTGAPPDAETARIAASLRQSVTLLSRRLRSERSDYTVKGSSHSVLGQLFRADSLTATELAQRERVQPQSLTRILAELEGGGLIRREPSETDRRQVRIAITPQGRDLLLRDIASQDLWLGDAMATGLTAAERNLLDIAAWLMTRLAEAPQRPERRAITLDPGVLDHYAGRYQFTPALTATVTRVGNRLFYQLTGQVPYEIFPEGPAAFFWRAFDAQVTFEPGPDGPVTELVVHQYGRTVPAIRIA